MFLQKHGETHKHTPKPAYIKVKWDSRSALWPTFTEDTWLLLWVCADKNCNWQEAYDLTHTDPAEARVERSKT